MGVQETVGVWPPTCGVIHAACIWRIDCEVYTVCSADKLLLWRVLVPGNPEESSPLKCQHCSTTIHSWSLGSGREGVCKNFDQPTWVRSEARCPHLGGARDLT